MINKYFILYYNTCLISNASKVIIELVNLYRRYANIDELYRSWDNLMFLSFKKVII